MHCHSTFLRDPEAAGDSLGHALLPLNSQLLPDKTLLRTLGHSMISSHGMF